MEISLLRALTHSAHMVYTRDFIKVFGLALGVTLLKLGNGNEHCDHPWRQDFGLRISDSIEESFNSLSNILERFFKNTTSGVPSWLNAMTFFIGVGVGTLFGGFASFIAFRRKYSSFGLNKKENVDKAFNDDICFNEVTEYSEIPEYTKRVDLEEKEKMLDETDLREDQKNMTNVEYHECIPMFSKDSKSESDFEKKHIDVKEHKKGKENEYMEHPLGTFSNNPDIDTDDKKPKGQNGVTVVLYETPTEPYFLLSTTRATKDSNPDSIGCTHYDKNQGERANSKPLPITSEDVNHKNTDESTYQEGKEQPIENEYFVLKERS
ncbi:uncharacterized protein [Magallana gigas]|uniref:uncharacterized protein isoform X2 n=1 Tax=Magallana gigas TaxID=29159 RepID=UPI00333EDDE3